MADFILCDGDIVNFFPQFGSATIIQNPLGKLSSSIKVKYNNSVCVKGDEANVVVNGCMYISPPFTIPGIGKLSISALSADQIAKKTKAVGKAVLLKGGQFTAKFEVTQPAQFIPPPPATPQTDPITEYSGFGVFITTNTKLAGS